MEAVLHLQDAAFDSVDPVGPRRPFDHIDIDLLCNEHIVLRVLELQPETNITVLQNIAFKNIESFVKISTVKKINGLTFQ